MNAVPPPSATRRSERSGQRRPTIAVLLDYMSFFGGAYENHIRASLEDTACRRDVNLVFYFGRGLYEPHPTCAPQNAIFDLVHPDRVDGVVAISSVLTSSCGADRFMPFMQRYRPLPVCSVGVPVPGVPSLVVDNALGISEVVLHLVEQHHRKHIAFVSGPSQSPESQVRASAFRSAIARAGLPFRPELSLEGGFASTVAMRPWRCCCEAASNLTRSSRPMTRWRSVRFTCCARMVGGCRVTLR